ncbi:MAG: FAD-dependent oxidoreductase [Gemmatimonadota bacterium]
MTDGRLPQVVVVGGCAGAAIAHRLAEEGKRVTLLCHGDDVPSATDTNQKWLHSGLLYPSESLAERAWTHRNIDWDIKAKYLVGPQKAYFLALTDDTLRARTDMWAKWKADGRRVPDAYPLEAGDRARLASLGINFSGGWVTPDCAVDFPALVRDMRRHIAGQLEDSRHLPAIKATGTVMEGARVLDLRRGPHGMTGVDYEWHGRRGTLTCDQCIVAAGAWSHELLEGIGVSLPLIRKKCLVVAFKRGIRESQQDLDRITVWLDVEKEDGTRGDFTLVPYRDHILAAGTDFRVVYGVRGCSLEALRTAPSDVAALNAEMDQCFASASVRPFSMSGFTPRTCFKTEQYNASHPCVDIKVYTEDEGMGGHGVRGLTVALPGKASLMFDLAREVAKHIV